MDINNELQQINTFVKGMNTDVSDALMDSSQYRYAENVRLATNTDENTGELRLIEGTSLDLNLSGYGRIMAMTSVRDLVIVVTEKQTDKGIRNFILAKDTKNESLFYPVFYSDDTEGDYFGEHISLVTRWENDKDIKLYIADGKHSLMYINLATGESEKSLSFEDISSVVYEPLDSPKVSISENAGTLPPVKVLYCYRMYKEGGSATTLSPFSNIAVIYDNDKGYSNTIEESEKSANITIPTYTSDDGIDKMLVFRISYRLIGQAPTVDLIYDGEYTNLVTDSGNRSILSSSLEELLAMIQGPVVPHVIESKNDYLFAANISYVQDDVDAQLEDLDSSIRIYSSGDIDNGTILNYNKQFGSASEMKTYNEAYWKKPNDQNVIGGSGDFIDWEIIEKPIYISDTNEKYETFLNGSLLDRITKQINSLRQGEVYRYGAIFYNNKGQKSSVKWLCDIMAPIRSYETYSVGTRKICKVIQIGIKFTIHTLPGGFSGVEIVRAPRLLSDKIRLVQCIGGFPYGLFKRNRYEDVFTDNPNAICAPHFLSTNLIDFPVIVNSNDLYHSEYILSKALSDRNYLVLACPEFAYQSDDIRNVLSGILLDVNLRLYLNSPMKKTDIPEGDRLDIRMPNSSVYNIINYNGNTTSNIWTYDNENLDIANGGRFIYNGRYTAFSVWRNMQHYRDLKYINTHNVNNIAFADIYPNFGNIISSDNLKEIDDILYTPSINDANYPDYNTAVSNKQPVFENSSVNIGNIQYINWTIPLMYGQVPTRILNQWTDDGDFDDSDQYLTAEGSEALDRLRGYGPAFVPTGGTGKYILIKLQNSMAYSPVFVDSSGNYNMSCMIINIMKRSPNPYGGRNTVGTQNYIQCGNYHKGTGELEVFDGDCYPGIFIFNAVHAWYDTSIIFADKYNGIRHSCVYFVPIESDIDLSATYGDLYNRVANGYYIQDKASSFDGFTLGKDAYLYNTAYSYEPKDVQYSTVVYTSVYSNLHDCRVCHSNVKTNGETIDSWLFFSPLNFIDVDTRFGLITNMRLFKDKLLFWQEHATGVLSVNERTVLNDLENNDIVVGTGGTLLRYDYISTTYGMKPYQYEAEVQSNYTQYWWDGYNKEILSYTGGELIPLVKMKGVTNYINSREEAKHPALAYDVKYDEILAQVVNDTTSEQTIVYNEQIQAFSSIYTFNPRHKATAGSKLYLGDSSNSSVYIWNSQYNSNYSLLFDTPAFPKVRIVINKNNIYTKTFDNLTFGGRMYKGSMPTIVNWPMDRVPGNYIKNEHLNAPMHHLIFTFETPLKQSSSVRGDKATSVDEYDYRLAIPRNGFQDLDEGKLIKAYGNRMRGKTMQCEIASDYNSTDFSLQYITTKFRMSWS